MKTIELTPEERKFLGEVANLNAFFRYDGSESVLLSIAEKVDGASGVKRPCEVSFSEAEESAIVPILRHILAQEVPLVDSKAVKSHVRSTRRLSAAILANLLH